MSDHENEDQPEVRGFSFEVPPGIIQEMVHNHEREHMKAHDMKHRIWELIDQMTVEQLYTMRQILHFTRRGLNSLDGQIIHSLRTVHQVDPDHPLDDLAILQGESPETTAEPGDPSR